MALRNAARPAETQSSARGGLRATGAILGGVLVAAAVLAGATLLYLVNPSDVSWLPKCPLYMLTGWHCPGCGITRAAHALLHGDLAKALASNPLAVVLVPTLLAYALWQRWKRGPDWANQVPARGIMALFAVLLVFAVLRNVPAYPFQLLAPH